MSNLHNLINREVKIGDKEGEISKVLGVNFLEVTFFDINDGKTVIGSKDIYKFLVKKGERICTTGY